MQTQIIKHCILWFSDIMDIALIPLLPFPYLYNRHTNRAIAVR